jgi:carboxylesterase
MTQASVLPLPVASSVIGPKAIELKGGRHGVMLFHGLGSSPLELSFIARGLHRAGYSVNAPLISCYTHGLGQSTVANFDMWLKEASRALEDFAAECDTISIGGLCIGSVVALRLSQMFPEKISHVVALSTALHFDGWANPWYTFLLPLARYVPFVQSASVNEEEPFGLKDQRMREFIQRQMLSAGKSEVGAASLSLRGLVQSKLLIRATRRALALVKAPLLLIHAKEDECASPKSAYEIVQRVSSSDIRLVMLSDSYHMITVDQEKSQVLDEVLQFIDADRAQNKVQNEAQKTVQNKSLPVVKSDRQRFVR